MDANANANSPDGSVDGDDQESLQGAVFNQADRDKLMARGKVTNAAMGLAMSQRTNWDGLTPEEEAHAKEEKEQAEQARVAEIRREQDEQLDDLIRRNEEVLLKLEERKQEAQKRIEELDNNAIHLSTGELAYKDGDNFYHKNGQKIDDKLKPEALLKDAAKHGATTQLTAAQLAQQNFIDIQTQEQQVKKTLVQAKTLKEGGATADIKAQGQAIQMLAAQTANNEAANDPAKKQRKQTAQDVQESALATKQVTNKVDEDLATIAAVTTDGSHDQVARFRNRYRSASAEQSDVQSTAIPTTTRNITAASQQPDLPPGITPSDPGKISAVSAFRTSAAVPLPALPDDSAVPAGMTPQKNLEAPSA